MFERIGHFLGKLLERERKTASMHVDQDFAALAATIRVGDVLLVEGRARVSTVIKYLTQSTWSHAALCVQDARAGGAVELVEVTLQEGAHRIPLDTYKGFNTRICRAVGLSESERLDVAGYMFSRIGTRYDLRNIFDLVRYFMPAPPVPAFMRSKLLTFGSGKPTRAICSTLVAQAFQSVHYPILPDRDGDGQPDEEGRASPPGHVGPIWRRRHYSLFVPRDFDLSPYFAVIKPTLEQGFDYRKIVWDEASESRKDMG